MPRQILAEQLVTHIDGVNTAHIAEIVNGLPGSRALLIELEIDNASLATAGPLVRSALEAVWRERNGKIPGGQLRAWTRDPSGPRRFLNAEALIRDAGFRGARAAGDDIQLRPEWLVSEFGLA